MSQSKIKTIKKSRPPVKIKTMTRSMRNKRRTLDRLLTTKDQSLRLIKYLKMICSDSCGCLSFGRENEKIKKLFNGFRDFDYSQEEAKKIKDTSVNGFAYEIKFLRNIEDQEYESSVLLKSAIKKLSDNLYYEYIVGYLYINKVNLLYPCFTETYHLLENKSNELKEYMQNNSTINVDKFKNNFNILNKFSIENSCTNSDKLSIMVQYIKNPLSFHKYLSFRKNIPDKNLPYDLTHMLFQIYGPLSRIKEEYTHYDLHTSNMLLYELDDETYITMNYIYEDHIVTFKSNKISKMIDYGRSYFYLNSTVNTSEIYKQVCKEKSCKSKCGNDVGFSHLRPQSSISSYIPNISQDLRLASMIIKYNLPIKDKEIYKVLEKIQFTGRFRTDEHVSMSNNIETILNVDDMEKSLKELILKEDFIFNNERQFENSRSVGSLNIFMTENKEMVFTGINVKGKKNTPTIPSFSTKYISTQILKQTPTSSPATNKFRINSSMKSSIPIDLTSPTEKI
jgi:hypothetical protein